MFIIKRKPPDMYIEFCTGCGLCKSINNTILKKDEHGFFRPVYSGIKDYEFWSNVCPASGNSVNSLDIKNIWGNYIDVYCGHSNDEQIRFNASSGGILTECASFLLKEGHIDAVIHVGADPDDPIKSKVYCSTTPNEVIENSGSRYVSSSVLLDINNVLESGKKYAFIGKPCDVTALKNYIRIAPQVGTIILYTLSFFCAGVPSDRANEQLLDSLGCPAENCRSLSYRGNGWPGYATAVDQQGNIYKMDYDSSWGKILGRDIRKICRFCLDGIGEQADISCGDAWYLTKEKKPDFGEHQGRNIIFARSPKGNQLITQMYRQKKITLSDYSENIEDLKHIQTYQYERKATMFYRMLAMKTLFRSAPLYSLKSLVKYQSSISIKTKVKIYLGTIKRIINGKI